MPMRRRQAVGAKQASADELRSLQPAGVTGVGRYYAGPKPHGDDSGAHRRSRVGDIKPLDVIEIAGVGKRLTARHW